MAEVSIGIAITTHNRYKVFKDTYQRIVKLLPPGAKLVVVDDASKKHVPEATFRFDENVGIARAKNKCFELLENCEHIFLFDDDCYPVMTNWWIPYIESKEPHLMYIFENTSYTKELNGCREVYRDNNKVAYSHPRGCMLYFKKVCLETVGGMDTSYARWGFEHVDLSNRIFNAGLTSWRYMDVLNSHELIYSLDEHHEVTTTVGGAERQRYLDEKKNYYKGSLHRKIFCDIKVFNPKPIPNPSKVILTTYTTRQKDTERNKNWQADEKDLQVLKDSCKGNRLVVLTDSFEEKDTNDFAYVKIEARISPYIQRWISYYDYLMEHPEIQEVWLVDATDVELLRYPFSRFAENTLYVGYEEKYLDYAWLLGRMKSCRPIYDYMKDNREKTLLNAGIVGGKRDVVLEFLRQMRDFYSLQRGDVGEADMGLFNYVCYNYWQRRLVYGKKITTVFKDYEKGNKLAIWRHK